MLQEELEDQKLSSKNQVGVMKELILENKERKAQMLIFMGKLAQEK